MSQVPVAGCKVVTDLVFSFLVLPAAALTSVSKTRKEGSPCFISMETGSTPYAALLSVLLRRD